MATEKRMIYLEDVRNVLYDADAITMKGVAIINQFPTVDAVPVDEIKLHHVIIDNEGVPEVKLQIGDRYFLLRTDPVDVREVVHGWWIEKPYLLGTTRYCSICGQNYGMPHGVFNYCPNCGAVMEDKYNDGL